MLHAFDAALRLDRIARPYRGAEFYIVQPGVDRQFSLAQNILQKYAGGLRQDLTEDHARNDGILGKMSLQEELVTANSILSDGSAFPVLCSVHNSLRSDPEKLSSSLNSYLRIRNSSVPYSTTCPLATQISEITPSSSAAISFISFMASTTQRVCPFATLSPMET